MPFISATARRQQGFTYVGLIILVAIIGLVGAAGLKFGAIMQRRAAEQALLDIGAQFSDALRSYADATAPGQPTQPPSLKELLKDPRLPGTRRHLRRIFVDPITGKAEWGIIYVNGSVGVVSVYSLSASKPIKIGNFDTRFPNFDNKAHLSDWKFSMAGQAPVLSPLPPAAPLPAPNGAAPVANPANPSANGAVPAPSPVIDPAPGKPAE
ncbi:MAG TPA: type II secretion system protein [Janthinobacterium sp.]|jgi:type II secretory pathway pseudopilin PulG|nr:type II secretion system protein [Janthinobacterium sp.]